MAILQYCPCHNSYIILKGDVMIDVQCSARQGGWGYIRGEVTRHFNEFISPWVSENHIYEGCSFHNSARTTADTEILPVTTKLHQLLT